MRVHGKVADHPHPVPRRDSTNPQTPLQTCRAIATANTAIVTPISPSSTRQAVGRANHGASQRAPTPIRLNQARLAVLAPVANQPCCAPRSPTSSTVSRYTWGLSSVKAAAWASGGGKRGHAPIVKAGRCGQAPSVDPGRGVRQLGRGIARRTAGALQQFFRDKR